jgi:hypothetical protein
MNPSVRHVSVSPRRTNFAVALAITIAAAVVIALAFAVFTATFPSTGVLIFAPNEQDGTPFSATEVSSCVVQDPNGQGRGWVPRVPAITGSSVTNHNTFGHASLCVVQHPEGPGPVWVPHRPATVHSP